MFIIMFNLDKAVDEKPRNKRTAKGLTLSGAQGKNARRDSRSVSHNEIQHEARWEKLIGPDNRGEKKPSLDRHRAIREQLDEGQPFAESSRRRRQRQFPPSDVAREGVLYTSQSDDFSFTPRTKTHVAKPEPVVPANIDEETSLPLVIINRSEDAWRLCRGRR